MAELLSTNDVAQQLGVTKQYVAKLVSQGRLRPETPRVPGQTMWFTKAEVERFLSSRKHRNVRRSESFVMACNYFTLWEAVGRRTAEVATLWHRLRDLIDLRHPLPVDIGDQVGLPNLDRDRVRQLYRKVAQQLELLREDDHLIARDDPMYPRLLRSVKGAPEFLFVRGADLDMLQRPTVSIVGTRSASNEGKRRAYKLACLLCSKGMVVASGLARGIDRAAHEGALSIGGDTIAVIGTPLTQVYPPEHKDLQERIARFGLVVSQFYPGADIQRFYFPMRNAVMSGLSLGTVIIEASEKSGALIQARYCLQQGRKLFIPKSALENPALRWPKTYLSRPGAHAFSDIDELMDVLQKEGVVPTPGVSGDHSVVAEKIEVDR